MNSVLRWLAMDHLGSTAVMASETGARMAELRYKPWGETRYESGATPTTWRFTGQREDATIGLYFYSARYYDPALGRFVQPDTIVPEPDNPQALNRYSYVLNNPLRFIDDSGKIAIDIVGGGGGGAGMVVAMLISGLAQTAGQQASALTVQLAPAANATMQMWSLAGNQIIAAGDQLSRAVQNASQAGNTADPGGLDPNDPRFKELARQAAEQAESASCPNCGTRDPQLLRGRGAIAARQHVELAHVGEDGISAWCINCTSTAGKFWGRSMTEIQTFAKEIGLDPRKAVVYTPQFGGPGHWSLLIDAIGPDGYLLPQYAHLIDTFLRAGPPVIR